jgi:hypothetical protein
MQAKKNMLCSLVRLKKCEVVNKKKKEEHVSMF